MSVPCRTGRVVLRAHSGPRPTAVRWQGEKGSTLACPTGAAAMSKERKSNREIKKKAVLTPKEKKAAKKAKQEAKPILGIDRTR